MIVVAILAVFIAGGRRLIMGDGGVTVELFNGIDRPIKDIRIASKGESIVANELAPGEVVRGRLWPGDIHPRGWLDGVFQVSFTLDGKPCQTSPSHTFYLLESDSLLCYNIINIHEP